MYMGGIRQRFPSYGTGPNGLDKVSLLTIATHSPTFTLKVEVGQDLYTPNSEWNISAKSRGTYKEKSLKHMSDAEL